MRRIVSSNSQSTEAQLFSSGHPTNGNPWNKVLHPFFFISRLSRDERQEGCARERGPSREYTASNVIDLCLVLRFHNLCSSCRRLLLTFLPFGERENEEIGFHLFSRNLKPQLLRLSLNASQFSAAVAATTKTDTLCFIRLVIRATAFFF